MQKQKNGARKRTNNKRVLSLLFIKAVNEFAYKRAMNGAKIGGRKLVQIRATEKWTGSPKFIDCDHNVLFNDPKPRTPKQVRAILKKDGRSEKEIARLVDEQCTKASSGLKLVSEEDRGVEVKVDAESVFTKTTKTN